MNIPYVGELAAFGTALCWTFGAQLFESAGKRVGSMSVNFLRLCMALLMFGLLSMYMNGNPLPVNFPVSAWLWLGLSGVLGVALGDLFLFEAFVEIGPRLSMLIMTLTAPIAALLGMIFLKEDYGWLQWVAMLVTLGGVAWVILERPGEVCSHRKLRVATRRGIVFAFLGTVGQASGLVLSKHGMHVGDTYLDPFSATQIRVISGIAGVALFVHFKHGWPAVKTALHNTRAMGLTWIASFLGLFLGVSLSLLSLHYINAGIASTILALVPILIIPCVMIIGKEHVSLRAMFGAFIAVAGVVMLVCT